MKPLELPAPLGNFMREQCNAQMLRYQAGQTIFCPACEQCLDWRNAVSIDVIGATSGKLHFTKMLCGPCADKYLVGFNDRLGEAARKAGESSLRVETTDGRDYDDDEQFAPCKATLGASVQFLSARRKQVGKRQFYTEAFPGNFVDGLCDWGRFVCYESKPGCWFVLEFTTGMALCGQSETAKEALNKAFRTLRKAGKELFLRTVANAKAINTAAESEAGR